MIDASKLGQLQELVNAARPRRLILPMKRLWQERIRWKLMEELIVDLARQLHLLQRLRLVVVLIEQISVEVLLLVNPVIAVGLALIGVIQIIRIPAVEDGAFLLVVCILRLWRLAIILVAEGPAVLGRTVGLS